MAIIKDIASFHSGNHPIKKSKLWEKDVAKITPEELIAFMKRMAMNGQGHQALKNVESILHETRKLIARGEIESAKIETFKLPTKKYTLSSLQSELSAFSRARRDALIVSILSGLTIEETVTLKRSELSEVKLSSEAREVIASFPAHIQTDYVFWEYVGGRLTTIDDLASEFELVSNFDIQHYRDNLDLNGSVMSQKDYWVFRRAFWKSFIHSF